MKIKATINLRNESLVIARRRLGLSQRALAQLAGVEIDFVSRIERLDFRCFSWEGFFYPIEESIIKLRKISQVLEINPRDIVPLEVLGKKLPSRLASIKEYDPSDFELMAAPETKSLPLDKLGSFLRDNIEELIQDLPLREREIILARYGLNKECKVYTLDEVGKLQNLSRERIRKLEIKALETLRASPRSKILYKKLEMHSIYLTY